MVGQVIKESGIPREEFFVVSKVWKSNAGYENTKISTIETLKKMKLGYLDLMLIHWPGNEIYPETD